MSRILLQQPVEQFPIKGIQNLIKLQTFDSETIQGNQNHEIKLMQLTS